MSDAVIPAGDAAEALTGRIRDSHLVVIDAQSIFADPTSEWGSPLWDPAWENMVALIEAFGTRTAFTRWLPTANRETSWGDYFRHWPFADVPADHALYELVPQAQTLAARVGAPIIDCSTFGKWGAQLAGLNSRRHLVLTGVATDCCVVSTALAAADAGAYVTVVADACAGSDDANQRAAVTVMSLYSPQIEVVTAQTVLDALA